MESMLIGCIAVVPMVLLVMTCLLSRCRRKKTREEVQREMFQKFYKKYMLPNYWGAASRVDFVRRPEDNLDTTQSSFAGRSEHTYEDISSPSFSKKDVSLSAPPRSPDSSVEKCCVVDDMNSTNTETNSSCSTQESDEGGHTTNNWLQTPGRLASYISFRQTSHAILVVPSANNVASTANLSSAENREGSDSDNNSMDYGSQGIQITVPKQLNFDSSDSEQTKKKKKSKVTNDETDFNFSSNYYEKDSKKELSKAEMSFNKTDPTYESIKSLTIPKIKLFKEKNTGSGSSGHTYESLNYSDLCFDLARADGLESVREDVSDASNFRRSFESVKSGRDFTVFEINCDDEDDNDVFPENLSINSAHTLRHSYPGALKENPTDSIKSYSRNHLNKSQTGCINILEEEERYSPFPVAKKLSLNHRAKPVIASPRLCMIQTISGNLRPKSFIDSDENSVLNTPRSVPKIKIYDSDCVFNSSFLPNGQKDKSIPDILQNTESVESVSEVFDSTDDKIPPMKTYQTLRTIYSHARRAARAKKSLMSLPSVTEQTELELDQHLANNLYVKSTPLPTEEMV